MVIIKTVGNELISADKRSPKMMIKIATCLLALSVFTACQSTQSTASSSHRQTLAERTLAANQNATVSGAEAPIAAGPEDIPAEGPVDPGSNPALLPTPLLRASAAGGL